PAVHDPRTYRLKAVLATALPVIPSKVNWAPSAQWPMWCNDKIGCCTQVSVASAIRTWTGAAQAPVMLTDPQVIDNYSAESGYVPGEPSTDEGGVELDVLNRWRIEGYERPGQTRDYLTAFGYVDPKNNPQVQRAIAFLGGLYIGLSLPNYACAVGDFDWIINPLADNSIAGGHAVFIHGYDADWLYLNTWGAPRRMSYAFFQKYCDEAYGLVSRQNWTGITGVSPDGEVLDGLVAEMQASVGA
ncbi:C1 family peptidase, partial [Acetobacter oeni]